MKSNDLKTLLQDLADLHEELDGLLKTAIAEPLSAEEQVRHVGRALEALRSLDPLGRGCGREAEGLIGSLGN